MHGPPVACAGGTCNPNQVCCFNPTGPGDHCGDKGKCPAGYVELSCSQPADCPGQVCCATFILTNGGQTVQYTGASCAASCGDLSKEFTLCSGTCTPPPMGGCVSAACQPGTLCWQSTLLGAGYDICHQ
jgi:hypothetical protein